MTLFLNGVVVTDDSFVGVQSGDSGEVFLEFTAIIGDALGADRRATLCASLALRPYDLWQCCLAARDDKTLAMVVARESMCEPCAI